MTSRLYTYYPKFEDDGVYWAIHETLTDQVIAAFFFEDDAIDYMEWLEDGGAFAGFTPSFMIQSVASGDINDAFEATFT
jgi:hypothetical protein